jgi:hypothetical protein
MKISGLLGLIVATCVSAQAISTQAMAVEDQVLKELVPTGKLRVGLAYAPAPTPIFVARTALTFVAPLSASATHLQKSSAFRSNFTSPQPPANSPKRAAPAPSTSALCPPTRRASSGSISARPIS